MNSLIQDGLLELKESFADFFPNKIKAQRIFRLRERNSDQLKEFVWNEYSQIMKEKGVEEAYRWSSFIFSGWTEKKLLSYSKKIWKAELKRKEITAVSPFKEMIGLVKFLLEKEWNVFIVTASPEAIIQEISPVFFIPKENVIGMKLLENNGISTSEIIEPYTYGEGKVKALLERVGAKPDLAFGDSENDFPLLKSATRFGVLIDKGNSELADRCRSINCLIQPVFR
jgi:phosphoserine phosphatase